MFLDSHRMVFTFLSLLDLLGVALAFRISILKIFKLLPNYLHRVTDITVCEKRNSSGHTYLLSKFGEISFEEYVTGGISQPLFNGDLVYKLRGSNMKRISSRWALKYSNTFDVESMTK